jgi:hypothetical protein
MLGAPLSAPSPPAPPRWPCSSPACQTTSGSGAVDSPPTSPAARGPRRRSDFTVTVDSATTILTPTGLLDAASVTSGATDDAQQAALDQVNQPPAPPARPTRCPRRHRDDATETGGDTPERRSPQAAAGALSGAERDASWPPSPPRCHHHGRRGHGRLGGPSHRARRRATLNDGTTVTATVTYSASASRSTSPSRTPTAFETPPHRGPARRRVPADTAFSDLVGTYDVLRCGRAGTITTCSSAPPAPSSTRQGTARRPGRAC